MALERIQKILARAGFGSRRKAEQLIEEGAVTLNGKIAQLGDKALWGKDAIKVNGKLLQYGSEAPLYLAFYKPRGVISTMSDPEGRPTLADYLAQLPSRVFPIGRLDFNSEGLIFLTNNGEFAEKIQKSDALPRVYEVKVKGHLDAASIRQLQKGAKVEDRLIKPHSIRVTEELVSKSKIHVALVGSGVQDVKAFLELKGFLVERITRVSIGNVTLRGLTPGQYKVLRPGQVEALIEQPELGIKALEAAVNKDEEEKSRRSPRSPIRITTGSKPSYWKEPRGRGEKSFGRRNKEFGSRDREFGERKRELGDRDRSFGGPKKEFGTWKKEFSSQDRPSFSDRKKEFGTREKEWSSRPKKFSDRNEGFSQKPRRSESGFSSRGPRRPSGPRKNKF